MPHLPSSPTTERVGWLTPEPQRGSLTQTRQAPLRMLQVAPNLRSRNPHWGKRRMSRLDEFPKEWLAQDCHHLARPRCKVGGWRQMHVVQQFVRAVFGSQRR